MADFCIKGLAVTFGNKLLFDDLSFEVDTPAFVAVVGSNGSGKTTLFKCIQNRMPHLGVCLYKDAPINPQLIASLPQHNHLTFNIKVSDVAVMGLYAQKKKLQNYSNNDFENVKNVLSLLGIAHLYDQNFQELSGGEQQLVWLSQLILQDKEVWLLDEPLQQLDVKNKAKISKLLQYYAYEKGKLIFCITHDLHFLKENHKGWLLNISSSEGLVPINEATVNKALTDLAV